MKLKNCTRSAWSVFIKLGIGTTGRILRGWRMRLTSLPSVNRLSGKLRVSTSHNLTGLQSLLQGQRYYCFTDVYFNSVTEFSRCLLRE
jgi:hypothetical protein